jgi:hypothetical protein
MLPPIQPGSILFLEGTSLTHDAVTDDAQRTGWNRSIYALRKGAEVVCGYLRQDHAGYTLSDTPHGATRSVTLGINEIGLLTRVGGIAVPV